MEVKKESNIKGYPKAISYLCMQKIKEQMEKCICKITIGIEQGTGFFCKIPFRDEYNLLPVLITNNHVINKNILNENNKRIDIDIQEENNRKKLNLNNRIKYTNEEYDVSIIEIKEEEDEINNFLELDINILNDILNNNNKNDKYLEQSIYIIQYPQGELSLSCSLLDKIYEDKKYSFGHKCSTDNGSSGSPILNYDNKVIGIHKEGTYFNKLNKGTFLNYPIKDFIQINYQNNKNKKYNFNSIYKYTKKSTKKENNNNYYELYKYYKASTHMHPLKYLDITMNNGWGCDGRKLDSKCYSGITDFDQTKNIKRFRCMQCDYDLCLNYMNKYLDNDYIINNDDDAEKRSLYLYGKEYYTIVHEHPLVFYDKFKDNGWACDGKNLINKCYSGINHFYHMGNIPRFRCQKCDFDLYENCMDHYRKINNFEIKKCY